MRLPAPLRHGPALLFSMLALLSSPLAGGAGAATANGLPAGEGPLIAVAANMTQAATAIADAFTATSGARVRLAFGSSGTLTRQILRGSPAELFIAADDSYPRRLIDADRTRDDGRIYATGRLALYLAPSVTALLPVPASPGGAADGTLAPALARLLTSPAVTRIAIANPQHAPYGAAAGAVLQHLGIAAAVSERLVLGENVSQTARFAATGGVQAAILPVSLVTLPALAAGRQVPIPASWHPPLEQRMVALRGAGRTALAFYAFMLSDPARAILATAGYGLPPAP